MLFKWFLPTLIKRSCEDRIPRSGEKGKKVNCFEINLDKDDSPYFLVTGYNKNVLTGLRWNGNQYSEDYSVNLIDIRNYELRVTHYYGLANIQFDNIYEIFWNYVTRMVYIKIHFSRTFFRFNQFFFNKKKLVTKKRMDLLQFMLNDQLDRTNERIDNINLMTKLYTDKWLLHPSRDDQHKILKIYLESLVESGDLRMVDFDYIVTGKAISTIEAFEKEEQRHVAIVKLQRGMLYLTIFLVIVGILQTDLIKLPTILNFSLK